MSRLTDQGYLVSDQYKDASNLNARIDLHRRFSTNKRGWIPWVFDQLHLPNRGRLLDLGCGPASLWAENVARIPTDWEIVLADLSPGMVAQARSSLEEQRRGYRFGIADAQAIPFADRTFDAVVANHMLYHVPDREQALSEICRVLKPGGHLYATTNGHNHMRELWEWMAAVGPDAEMADIAVDFGLENGAAQLVRFFSSVTLHRYPDALVVTDADALVAYALSTSRSKAIRAGLETFVKSIEREIEREGACRIQKDSGLFRAQKIGG